MRITIDVKRAEQSFDLDRGVQQNYLVVELSGQEIRIPCDEEQMGAAIRACMGQAKQPAPAPAAPATSREFSFVAPPDEAPEEPVFEEEPVKEAPPMFVVPESKPAPVPRIVQQQPAAPGLRPVARKPMRQADDAGISQG